MHDMKNKAENKEALDSKNAVKKPADEISEEVLREIAGGCFGTDKEHCPGDVREGISEENADQCYVAGEMNDIDGWN